MTERLSSGDLLSYLGNSTVAVLWLSFALACPTGYLQQQEFHPPERQRQHQYLRSTQSHSG